MRRQAVAGVIISTGLLAQHGFSQNFTITYPHSIVPGGIVSAEQYARQQGRTDVGFLRPRYLEHDLTAYVDYSIDNSVRWTAARVTVRKGELVWADKYGHIVRGRCGNDLRFEAPAKAFTPPEKPDLDTPEVAWLAPPDLPAEMLEKLPFEFPERWPDQPAYPEQAERSLAEAITAIPSLPALIPAVVGILLPTGQVQPVSSSSITTGGTTAVAPVFPTQIPEPATLWLLLSAAALLSARKLLSTKPIDPTEQDRGHNPDLDL